GRHLPRISLLEKKQRQVSGTARRCGPVELTLHRRSEHGHLRWIASEQVDTASEAIDPMNEQGKVYGRCPRQHIPRCRTLAHFTFNPRHDTSEHREKAVDRNRGLAVEGERAPPLTNHL